jgi:hypothetical protein
MTTSADSESKLRAGTADLHKQHLSFIVAADMISRFLKLLERGCTLKIKTGDTIRQLLCQNLGIPEDYLDNRIQTIFLNGRPVDDVDTAIVENGSILALSAAMPGLVGITLRKGGFYASFRNNITYTEQQTPNVGDTGNMTLKLFNTVAKELGFELLDRGIRIEGNALHDFIQRNLDDLKVACTSVHMNNEKIDLAGLLDINWKDGEAFIQVASA